MADDIFDELSNELSDELSGDLSDEKPVKLPREDIPERKDKQPETLSDELFTIKISEDMSIRNALRTGLVEAQGKDTEKMPMYVSWPGWLDDGIVCMFARDFHELLDRAVKDAAVSFGKTFDVDENSNVPAAEIQDDEPAPAEEPTVTEAEFKPLDLPELDGEA